jgi:hypothetical protein
MAGLVSDTQGNYVRDPTQRSKTKQSPEAVACSKCINGINLKEERISS